MALSLPEGPLVFCQGKAVETLPTLRALVGHLLCVSVLVVDQVVDLAEALPTFQVLSGLFP